MNKNKFKLVNITLITAIFFLGACSGKKVKLDDSGNKISKAGISVHATWLKDKGKKFDVQLDIANDSKKDIIILLGDISCYRGTAQGTLKHTFFNTGERVIDFKVGQMKSFNLVCDYHEKATGPMKILISRVFENPGSDGRTQGPVFTRDISWSAVDAHE